MIIMDIWVRIIDYLWVIQENMLKNEIQQITF